MNSEPRVFRHSTKRGWRYIQSGLSMILFGIAAAYLFSLFPGGSWGFLPPLIVLGALGMLLVFVGLPLVRDRSPRLSIDRAGVTDHVSADGERRFPWEEIQGVSWRTTGRHNESAELTLYLRGSGTAVSTHTIPITTLEGGPAHVGTEVKRCWLQAISPGTAEPPPAAAP